MIYVGSWKKSSINIHFECEIIRYDHVNEFPPKKKKKIFTKSLSNEYNEESYFPRIFTRYSWCDKFIKWIWNRYHRQRDKHIYLSIVLYEFYGNNRQFEPVQTETVVIIQRSRHIKNNNRLRLEWSSSLLFELKLPFNW